MAIGDLIDTSTLTRPVLLEDGSLEDDLNGDGIVDLVISQEVFESLFQEPDDGFPGMTFARSARLTIDTDFDGEADLYFGTGFQVRSGEPDTFVQDSEAEMDGNDDSEADSWTINSVNISYKQGDDWFVFSRTATVTASDTDFDGQIDRWLTEAAFDSVDNDGDGVIETWVKHANVLETDTDSDGTADYRETWGEAACFDEDGDGIIDLTYYYGKKYEELTAEGWVVLEQLDDFGSTNQARPNEFFYYSW